MRLRLISEKRYFHGTDDPNNILKRGLQPGMGDVYRDSVYLGSIKQALAYGDYLVEVEASSDQLVDEDAIISIADPDDPSWVDQVINLPEGLRGKLHSLAMQVGGWEPGYSDERLSDFISKHNLRLRGGSSGGSADNIRVPYAVGFDGDTHIVAIYKMRRLDRKGYGFSNFVVDDVLFDRGGSLKVGDVVKGSNEKWFHSS